MRTKHARRIRLTLLVARYDSSRNALVSAYKLVLPSLANSIKEPTGIGDNLAEALQVFHNKEATSPKGFYSKLYFKSYEKYKEIFQPRATKAHVMEFLAKIDEFHNEIAKNKK